jgi:hypothetical protein
LIHFLLHLSFPTLPCSRPYREAHIRVLLAFFCGGVVIVSPIL